MATLAKLVVKLITDVSEFEAGMKASQKKLTGIGDQMSKVGGVLTAGVTLPLVAAGAASIKMASDLNESANKVQVVFGKASKTVEDFSKTAAMNLGMSSQEALEAAGTFGNIFTTMGMDEQVSADMSTRLLTLSADLASFNNIDPGVALEKLRSGLVGEAEPLKSMGILINDAMLKSKALEMGLGGVNGVLTDAEKVQVRYALILEQTSKAQGDFARTSDGLANSTRIANALFKDTLASFGQQLLPLAIKAMQLLIPILQFFNNLPAPIKTVIIVLAGLAAALGPVILIGGQLIGAISAIMGLFGAGGALAGAGAFITTTLIPALVGLPALIAPIGAGFVAIGLPVIALIAAIGLLALTIVLFGKDAWNTVTMVWKILETMDQRIKTAMLDAVVNVLKQGANLSANLIKIFAALPGMIGQKLSGIGQVIWNALKAAWQAAVNWASGFYNAGQNLILGFINGIVSYSVYLVQTVMRVVQSVIDAVRSMLGIHSKSTLFMEFGMNSMLGWESGVDQFASKPVAATADVTQAVIPAATAIRSGGAGGRSLIVNATINGDLSAGQKASLAAWFEDMLEDKVTEYFGEPA